MKNKKLNRKGFTLIELLAVIVILAIILVIAVPNVLEIQRNSKKDTTRNEAYFLADAISLCTSSVSNASTCTYDGADIGKYYENKSILKTSCSTGSGTCAAYTLDDDMNITSFTFTSNGYKITTGTTTVGGLKSAIKAATIAQNN